MLNESARCLEPTAENAHVRSKVLRAAEEGVSLFNCDVRPRCGLSVWGGNVLRATDTATEPGFCMALLIVRPEKYKYAVLHSQG